MNSNPSYKVSIPELSGGMNTNAALNMIEDNQLTDSLNMWWKDGALRTRDGFESNYYACDLVQNPFASCEIKRCGEVTFKDGEKYDLYSIYNDAFIRIDGVNSVGEDFFISQFAPDEGYRFEGTPLVYAGSAIYGADFQIYIIAQCYLISNSNTKKIKIYRQDGTEVQGDVTEQCYVPTIYVNGKGNNYSTLPTTDQTEYPSASMFEGLNMLTGKFKAYFKTDGVSDTFPFPVKNLDNNGTVTIKYTANSANGAVYTYNIVFPNCNSNVINDGYFGMTWWDGTITYYNASDDTETALPAYSGTNNLEVIAYKSNPLNQQKIAKMTTSTWFGGTDGGGGTRLFLCGNPDEPNLIHWSDLNNPLYFPENNYAYIGDSAQKVTGFAKQSDMLVIFKPKETYYTNYVTGNDYTVNDVIGGAVTDVTTVSATFPIYQIHSSIGCDLPNTIQLCSNRLVWATTDKKVYSLVTTYTYSEKNIYTVSELIERKFKDLDFTNSFALDYDNHYLLFVGKKVFVLDYSSAGYKYVSSYAKDTTAKTCWYEWDCDLGTNIISGCADANNLTVYSVVDAETETEQHNKVYYAINLCFTFGGYKDEAYNGYDVSSELVVLPVFTTTNISSMLQTKLFDFKSLERRKNVERVYLGVGANEESTINVSFVTERGINEDARTIEINDYADNYSPELIKTISILPSQPRLLEFGLKLESDGTIAVSGIVINYRMLGSVK